MDVTPGLRRVPGPDLEAIGQDEELAARIHAEIERDGPITFARFMELALYDPAGGYYRSEDARPGRGGDFLTAPETHPIFGATLARAVSEAWERLDRPEPFVLREYGAGTGTLALTILAGLDAAGSPLAGGLRYEPIEVEPRRLEAIAARFRAAGRSRLLVDAVGAPAPIEGVVIANEVLDALPTHRVIGRQGGLHEVFVGSRDGRLVDVEGGPSTRALADRLQVEGIALADGQRGEVCLALDSWLASAAAGLERGLLLLIDYGYPAAELYDPLRRHDGTLRAYVRQRVHDEPYRHVGRQDLTAHVDVSAVERAAGAAGLSHLGTTTQAEFLVGLGIQEGLQATQADPSTTLEDYLALRSSLMRLLDPAAMGRFRVMGFGRAWPDGPPIPGFAYRLVHERTKQQQTTPD
ncbi:MAG: class I SAM-dependent methyltransferase [Candidatus Limnocylindrales bacterium]